MTKAHKARVRLTTTQEVTLAALYVEQAELPVVELARRFNVSPATVSAVVRRQGVKLRHRPIDETKRATMIALYRSGNHSGRDIANLIGHHTQPPCTACSASCCRRKSGNASSVSADGYERGSIRSEVTYSQSRCPTPNSGWSAS